MLGRLLEKELVRDDPECAAAVSSLTASKKVRREPSRCQHKENKGEREMVSSGSRAMFSIISLASFVLVSTMAPSILSKKLQAFC